jgi:DASS family divalent anion:Na+ symporter
VTETAWHVFAIFVATIAGLILQPLSLGAVVLIGTTLTMITIPGTKITDKVEGQIVAGETVTVQTVTGESVMGKTVGGEESPKTLRPVVVEDALEGYKDKTVWLIVAAFLFARAFSKTGLGRRIAFLFIRVFGKRTLGLGYALAMTDLVLAPGIPSGAARTGGVLFPVVKSLASNYGSEPGPTASRIGGFLMLSAYQTHAVTCSMFLTSMVANARIATLTKEAIPLDLTWAYWAKAALVPGIIAFLLTPYLVYRFMRPEIRETPEAAAFASAELKKMGPVSRHEKIVLGVFLMTFLMWLTGSLTKLEPTAVAFIGLGALLLLGTLKWEDILAERAGWDALIWFGGLVSMTTLLNKLGLMKWFETLVKAHVAGWHVAGWHWMAALGLLALLYLYSHYFFASLNAHTIALFQPFLLVAVAYPAMPKPLAALVFAFFSSLCASLTHYGGGPSPVYWGSGYLTIKQWWTVGFAASVMFVLVWLGIGPLWWKALGLWE